MQVSKRKRGHSPVELQMAPMIDVVFLLLIFFIFASEWKVENDLATDMPKIVKQTARQPDFEPVRITLSGRGRSVTIKCNGTTCRNFEELHGMLRALRRIQDVPVTISAERTLHFQVVVNAVDAAVKAEFKNIGFAAT